MDEKKELKEELSQKEGHPMPPKKKRRRWKIVILALILLPFFVLFSIMGLLYVPAVQSWAVRFASDKIEQSSGLKIEMASIHIGFPLRLNVKEFVMISPKSDTMAYARSLSTSVPLFPLLNQQIDAPRLWAEGLALFFPDSAGTSYFRMSAEQIELAHVHADLRMERVDAAQLKLSGSRIEFFSTDTVPSDTPPLQWRFAVEDAHLAETEVLVHMPYHRVYTHDRIQKGHTEQVVVQLGSPFRLDLGTTRMSLYEGGFALDNRPLRQDYVDYTHLVVLDAEVEMSRFALAGSHLEIDVREAFLREQSGASVSSLSGGFILKDGVITLKNIDVATPYSRLEGDLELPLELFAPDESVRVSARMKGEFHPRDLYYFTQMRIEEFLPNSSQLKNSTFWKNSWAFSVDVRGTLKRMEIDELRIAYPKVMEAQVEGTLHHLLSNSRRSGAMDLQVELGDETQKLMDLLGESIARTYRIPAQSRLEAQLNLSYQGYQAQGKLKTAGGNLNLRGRLNPSSRSYQLHAVLQGVDIARIIPSAGLGKTTMEVDLKGKDWDLSRSSLQSDLDLVVHSAEFQSKRWDNLRVSASLKDSDLRAFVEACPRGVSLSGEVLGRLTPQGIEASTQLRLDSMDLHYWGVLDEPMVVSGVWNAGVQTNYAETHSVEGTLSEIRLRGEKDSVQLDPIRIKGETSPHHAAMALSSGDLTASMEASNGLNDLIRRVVRLVELSNLYLSEQPENMSLSTPFAFLPSLQMNLNVGTNNPLYRYLYERRIYFSRAALNLHTHPDSGLAADFFVRDLRKDTLRIDDVDMRLHTEYATQGIMKQGLDDQAKLLHKMAQSEKNLLVDTIGMQKRSDLIVEKIEAPVPSRSSLIPYLDIALDVRKKAYPRQAPFAISLKGKTDLQALDVDVDWKEKEQIRYSAGLVGYYNKRGLGLIVKNVPVIFAGEPLTVNPDNSLFYFTQDQKVFANLQLKGFEGAELSLVSSEEESADNIERVGLVIKKLQLEKLQNITGIPGLQGLTFADVQIEREGKTIRATGDLSINNFHYNQSRVGNLGIAVFYEPKDANTHYLTSQISVNGNQVMNADGFYHAKSRTSPIELSADLISFPLELLNPIIGNYTISLSGNLTADLDIYGTMEDLKISGVPKFDNAKVHSSLLGNTFRLDNRPILLDESKLVFDQYKVRIEGKESPLLLDGSMFVWGKDRFKTDMQISAKEVILLDSKPSPGQSLYGKLITDADLQVKGSLLSPVIRGDIAILGGTNCTYIHNTSSIKASDKMAGIVQFADFNDTISVQDAKPTATLGGMDIALNVHIDPAVRIGVDLSPGHQDYVEVVGGGDLRFSYSPFGQITLIGRYDASDGEVRYNFPVVGWRNFNINPNSSLLWSGPVDNPFINFKATQTVRADVVEAGASRKVDFLVSIVAKENLDRLNLAFDIESPEDIGVQTRLASMSPEERGKQAMGLMISKQFLASDVTNVSVDKLLSSLAMGELNSLIGKALDGTDLNVGIELNDPSQTGSVYTNYTYSFSRRFYNDRIRFVIGGKVSTGVLPANYEQTFIDNLTLEYRIDNAGRNFATIFHKRNSDNILEGLVTETGVGYVIKGKLDRLADLFMIFVPKRKKESVPGVVEKEKVQR